MSFDDDLKKRMALAQQQGWSQDEINRSAMIEKALNARQQQQQQVQATQAAKAKQPSGLKKFLVNAGAIAANTALGVGGVALAPVSGGASLAGAFAGGAGVEALRRKMLGEKQSVGSSLFEGALNAVPVVGAVRNAKNAAQLAKGGVELAQAANDTKKVVDATRRTAEIVPKKQAFTSNVQDAFKPGGADTNVISRKGNAVRGNAQGIYPGAKVGADELGVTQSTNLNKSVDEVLRSRGFSAKLFPKSTASKLGVVEQERTKIGQQIGDTLAKNNQAVTPEMQSKLADSIHAKLSQVADFNPDLKSHRDLFNTMIKQVDSPDLLGVEKGRRNVDQIAKSAFKESDSTSQFKARVAEAIRHGVDEFITGAVPTSKPLKSQYSKLIEAEKYMRKASAENVNVVAGLKGGAIPSASARSTVGKLGQGAKDLAGLGLQNTGRIISAPAAKQAGAQIGLHAIAGRPSITGETTPVPAGPDPNAPVDLAAAGLDPNSPDTQVVDYALQNGASDFNSVADMFKQSDAAGQPGASDGQSGYSSKDLFQAAIQAYQAGDAKSSDQLLQLAQYAQKSEADTAKSSGGGGPNITKVTAQQYGLAKSGSGALQQLSQMIQGDPNVITRTATPGRGLPIVGGFVSNAAHTGSYDAVGYNIADTILRLRTGAQANESEVKKLQTQIMPRAGDSQQTIQTKLAQINEIFSGVLTTAQNPGATDPFEQLMSQMQPQGAY